MSTGRPAIIDDNTQENMERTLDEVLRGVADGSLDPVAAKSGLLSLIGSVDTGNQDEIKTFTHSRARYTSIMSNKR
ncbi:hypothetical protein [Pseudomonas sp. UMAB-40]|uniref:hypothetical protein n=1 Tax=Pseudomonas sp. UMAB-40 TaxID=1365407 RepID=UPI001C5A54C5|nr:hypothetical protein [Pseudomonas sp. UMAB-40]